MSKINSDFMKKCLHEMLHDRAEKGQKPRKFIETVELQILMRDYDPDKRFNGSVKLQNKVRTKVNVNIFSCRYVF